jgi:hypothetical protein
MIGRMQILFAEQKLITDGLLRFQFILFFMLHQSYLIPVVPKIPSNVP